MTITNILVTLVVLGVAGYFGWLRPTGLASRNSAEREEDARRYLEKHGHWPDEEPGRRRR